MEIFKEFNNFSLSIFTIFIYCFLCMLVSCPHLYCNLVDLLVKI